MSSNPPSPLLQIGELARQARMTVRTLHHYDDIGLLRPRHRSAAGYRLYSQDDIGRLQHIQALRSLGLDLAQIARILDTRTQDIIPLLQRHIEHLDQQIKQQERRRDSLRRLTSSSGLASDWHERLEWLALCNRYLDPARDQALGLLDAKGQLTPAWRRRLQRLEQLRLARVPPDQVRAGRAAAQWMLALEAETRSDAGLFQQLRRMFREEPRLSARSGLNPELDHYLLQAYAHHRLRLFKPYLTPSAFTHLSQHYPDALPSWPDLMAELLTAAQAQYPPEHQAVQDLLSRWLSLQASYTLDAEAADSMRRAQEIEPGLQEGA